MSLSIPRTALFLGLAALLPLAAHAGDASPAAPLSLSGEASTTAAAPAPAWKLARLPKSAVAARIDYAPLPTRKLLQLQQENANRARKAVRIGVARTLSTEGVQTAMPALQWVADGRGGAVARLEVRSADAEALRVGLDLSQVDPRVELRFSGNRDSGRPVAAMSVAEARALPADDGLFWTPSTDGELQIVEFWRPAGVPAFAVRPQAPKLSHDVVDSRSSYKLLQKIGESGSCNVDVVCRVNELGPRFVEAKNAVAHMRFVVGSSTFICTGTLLNDSVPVTQVPYFHSANHCFSTNTSVAPVVSQMQTVANTLNTFWNYEASTCNGNFSTPQTQLSGGADYLYSSNQTDGMLLRLKNPAPAVAYFLGWDARPLPVSPSGQSNIFAIHHPAGDARMVSQGAKISQDSVQHELGWTSGTTEGGSSGSGIFTLDSRGYYRLRGGLFGGFASCANAGNLGNSGNRDYYSRLDVDIAQMRQWLAPQPIALTGSAPKLPPAGGTAVAPQTPAAARQPARQAPRLNEADARTLRAGERVR